MDDTHLQNAVAAELNREPSVSAAHIEVAAKAGAVRLRGHVETLAQKHAAEAAAHRVRGVKIVDDEIEVHIPEQTRPSDAEIAEAATGRLAWNSSVPPHAVKVAVKNGWVTLTGEVEWFFQKDAADQDVRKLNGITGVTDNITIKPKVTAESISDDIMHALHRSWFFDPQTITVSVDNGKVRLSGTVKTPHDRQIAAATAWAEHGVIDVQNDIEIG